MIDAADGFSSFAGGIKCREQNCCENGDDGNDYEKFDKSKTGWFYYTAVELMKFHSEILSLVSITEVLFPGTLQENAFV